MFIKIHNYPTTLDQKKEDYDIVLNTKYIVYIKSINDISTAGDIRKYLHPKIQENGFVISAVDKNYYVTLVEGLELINKLINQ